MKEQGYGGTDIGTRGWREKGVQEPKRRRKQGYIHRPWDTGRLEPLYIKNIWIEEILKTNTPFWYFSGVGPLSWHLILRPVHCSVLNELLIKGTSVKGT